MCLYFCFCFEQLAFVVCMARIVAERVVSARSMGCVA